MWLIAQIHGIADTVDKRLQRNGFETFLPTYIDNAKILALYPGYIFVGFFDGWPVVSRTDGVVRILGDGENPHIVGNEIIEKLRDVKDLPKAPAHHFFANDIVRVKSGEFVGFTGRYHQGLSKGEKSVILLDFLGGTRKITLRTDQLEGLPTA